MLLLILSASVFAQYCPVERVPTETELYVDRNNASGVFHCTATLTGIDLVTKATAPLPKETIYFQECAIGNFTVSGCPPYAHVCGPIPQDYWACPSTCCMAHISRTTDVDGKASVTFPLMDNVTIIALYLGGDVYLPSNSTGAFLYPPMFGALDIGACFPLILVMGLLMLSMSAMGRSPIGAFDFSSLRAPRARMRAPTAFVMSGAAIKAAVEGSIAGKSAMKEQKAKSGAKTAEKEAIASGTLKRDDKGNYVLANGKDKAVIGKKTFEVKDGKLTIRDTKSSVAFDSKGRVSSVEMAKKDGEGGARRGGFFRTVGRAVGLAGKIAYSPASGAGKVVRKTGGSKGLLGVIGSVGKGLNWVADKQLRIMTAGTIGTTGGRVKLTKLVGGAGKFMGRQVATGFKWTDDKLGGVPSAIGKGATWTGAAVPSVAKRVLTGAKIATGRYQGKPLFLGGKVLGLNIGLGLGGTVDDYNKFAWDPTGATQRSLDADRNSIFMQDFHVARKAGQGVLQVNAETVVNDSVVKKGEVSDLTMTGSKLTRAEQVEILKKKGLIEERDGVLRLTAQGENKYGGLIHERYNARTKEFDFVLTKRAMSHDATANEACAIRNAVSGTPGAAGVDGISYSSLKGISDISDKVARGEEVRVSSDEKGVRFGYNISGFGIPRTGAVGGMTESTSEGDVVRDLYISAPESGTFGSVANFLNIVGGPDIISGLLVSKLMGMGPMPIGPTGVLGGSFYTMRFGRIQQIGAMDASGSGYSPATYAERVAVRESEQQKIAEKALNKNPSEWTPIEVSAVSSVELGEPAMVSLHSRLTEADSCLLLRSMGLGFNDAQLKGIGKVFEENERSSSNDEIRRDLLDTQKGPGLTDKQADMILAYTSRKSNQEGIEAMGWMNTRYNTGTQGDTNIWDDFEKGIQDATSNTDFEGRSKVGKIVAGYMASPNERYGRGKELLQQLRHENEVHSNIGRVLQLTGGSEALAAERAGTLEARRRELVAQANDLNTQIQQTEQEVSSLSSELPTYDEIGGPGPKGDLTASIPAAQAKRQLRSLKDQLEKAKNNAATVSSAYEEMNQQEISIKQRSISQVSQAQSQSISNNAERQDNQYLDELSKTPKFSEIMDDIAFNLTQDRIAEIRRRRFGEDNWDYSM
ncbi:MAG: hypothetical protein ABIF01_00005 [Candidatus Micrarchaeota archaeon]